VLDRDYCGKRDNPSKISKLTAYKIYKRLHNIFCSPNIMWMKKSRRRSCYEIRDFGTFLVEALR
jgi:hypothetical protein